MSGSSTCSAKWGYIWNAKQKHLHLVSVQHRHLCCSSCPCLHCGSLTIYYPNCWYLFSSVNGSKHSLKPAMQETRFTVFQSIPQHPHLRHIVKYKPYSWGTWANIPVNHEGYNLLSSLNVVLESSSLLGAWTHVWALLIQVLACEGVKRYSSLQNVPLLLSIIKETQNSSSVLIYFSKSCVHAGSGVGVLQHELEIQNTAVSHIRFVLPRDGYRCILGFMLVALLE